MQAIVTDDGHSASIKNISLPLLDKDGDILVKVEAVTLNPTDYKHVKMISEPGMIVGCDFAGIVVASKAQNSSVAQGDRVAGFVHGGKYRDRGSFAQYLKTDACLTVKIPKDLEMERAASVGIGGYTAAQVSISLL